MGIACSFLAAVSFVCFVRSAKEMLSTSNPDSVLIVFGFVTGLLMLSGASFAFLWINTRKIELKGGAFRITSLLGADEYSATDIISYWRLNKKQPPTVYFKKGEKICPVKFDIRIDPEGKILKLIEDNKVPFNHPVHIKNQKGILVIALIIALYALYTIFDSIIKYGTVVRPLTPIFLIFTDFLLIRSYFLQKKFIEQKNNLDKFYE